MRISTYLDAAAIGIPGVLGLLGVWLGFTRLLVSWPIRWLVPFFGACGAAGLAALYLLVNADMAAPLHLSGTAGTAVAGAVAFLAALVMLLMFMGNLRERVAVWSSQRRIGSAERILGGLFGIACGLLLVALPYGLYASLRSDPENDPAWVRESLSLPYLKSAGEAVKSVLSSYLPSPGQPLRRP
jgi:membrane protein required for colicin V production